MFVECIVWLVDVVVGKKECVVIECWYCVV